MDVLLVLVHSPVVEQGNRRVPPGLAGDPGQAQSLLGVEIPAGDDHRDQVLGSHLADHGGVGHVRGVVVVGDLDAADRLG